MTTHTVAVGSSRAAPGFILAVLLLTAAVGSTASAEPDPSHPHLFFAVDGIDALRERIRSGVPRQAWESILARCESELGPDATAAALG